MACALLDTSRRRFDKTKSKAVFQPCFNLFSIVMHDAVSILLILPQRFRWDLNVSSSITKDAKISLSQLSVSAHSLRASGKGGLTQRATETKKAPLIGCLRVGEFAIRVSAHSGKQVFVLILVKCSELAIYARCAYANSIAQELCVRGGALGSNAGREGD